MSVAHSYSDASSAVDDVETLEMLLEAYFVVVDGTLNKLTQVKRIGMRESGRGMQDTEV